MKTELPSPKNLVRITFEKSVPDVSWYRNSSWKTGHYKRFRHAHTMAQNIEGFEFFNEASDMEKLKALNPGY